jgi:hypothetical protein
MSMPHHLSNQGTHHLVSHKAATTPIVLTSTSLLPSSMSRKGRRAAARAGGTNRPWHARRGELLPPPGFRLPSDPLHRWAAAARAHVSLGSTAQGRRMRRKGSRRARTWERKAGQRAALWNWRHWRRRFPYGEPCQFP